MKRLLVAITVIMMLLPAAAWSMGANLEFESGFQGDGVANSWTQYGGAANSGSNTAVRPESTGTWSQKCDGTAAEGGVQQAVPTEAGKKYLIRAWAKCETGATASLSVDGGTSWATSTNTEWIQFMVTFAATGSTTLVLRAQAGVVYFDDLAVEDITKVGIPDPDGKAPVKLWWEEVNPGGIGGNPFTCGGVFDGNVILGQINDCVRMYGDQRVGDPATALVHNTPHRVLVPPTEWSYKGATMLNGHIIGVTGYGDFQQSITSGASLDWGADLGTIIPFNNNPLGTRRKVSTDSAAIATDGTYLYAYDCTGPSNTGTSTIYKFSMDHAANGGNGSMARVAPFPITITGFSRISGIGYWNGKIYAAEAFNGGQIFEIDCTTGARTNLLSAPNLVPDTGGNYGQIARYGDKIFLATHNGNLITWQLIAGTWTIVSADDLALFNTPNAYGLAVKGDGVNARYAWVTSGGVIHFYDLYPGTKTDLADPTNWGRYGYGAVVGDAVVTSVGSDGFSVENKKRTMGARVLTTGTLPAVNDVVSIQAVSGRSELGERILTASQVTVDGTYSDLEPLFITHKNIGPATGSAGLATDGMLVKISGKVTGYDVNYLKSFYIDDGSGVANDTPNADTAAVKGIKIVKTDGSDMWTLGWDFYGAATGQATVVGVVRPEKLADGTITCRIDARSDADIVITAP